MHELLKRFLPHRGDGKRIHARTYAPRLGEQKYQVYGIDLQHIAECDTPEMADLVQLALEKYLESLEPNDD